MPELIHHFIVVSVVILAVILLRQLLGKRISPMLRYGLWLLVALKLFIPVTFFESPFSLNDMVETGGIWMRSLPEFETGEAVSVDPHFTHSLSFGQLTAPTGNTDNAVSEVKPETADPYP